MNRTALLAVALGLAVTAGCRRAEPDSANCTLPALVETTAVDGMGVVRYCAPAVLTTRIERVQLLVDDSGSMKGFASSLPRLGEWIAHGLSQVRQTGVEVRENRTCYFSRGRGMHACSTGTLQPMIAVGDTNLHEAIATASDYDLSVIVTDGVDATGANTGDCAGGVDSACVARALAGALHPRPGASKSGPAGLWVIPLTTIFAGTLYTEQFPPPGFQPDTAIAAVARETSTNGVISGLFNDSRGRLAYKYQGPKQLLAFVVARDAEAGRALVAALVNGAGADGIRIISGLKSYEQGVASMAPIEVYPGYLPPVSWEKPRKVYRNDAEVVCGTLDVASATGGAVGLTCPGQSDGGWVELSAAPETRVSGCVRLQILPAMEISRGADIDTVQTSRWEGSLAEGSPPLRLTLAIKCDVRTAVSCGPGAPAVEWKARSLFPASADRLAASTGTAGAGATILALSTDTAAEMPHRIFGLRQTLEKLYREIGPDKPELAVSRLTLCRP